MEIMQIRLAIFLFLLVPFVSHAALISNAGFIPAPLWFSRDTFFAGETVRIYTVVYNGSDSDIRGTVEFLDGALVVGSDDFSLAKGGRSQDIWIDWKATEGDHRITARIVRARAAKAGGTEESIDLSQTATSEVRVSVDIDTDKDGVGNKADGDDDNDGVSDRDEERAGTNPLVKDAPLETKSNQESVSYPAVSPLDKIAEIATEKTEDTGSTILAFTESVRERGSALLDRNANEARKEVENIRAAREQNTEQVLGKTARARQIADQKFSQSMFDRAGAYLSSLFSKATGFISQKDDTAKTSEKGSSAAEFGAVHTPFVYLKLFLFATLAFLFRHAIFFYLLLIFLAYILIRALIRFVRNR